MKQELLKALDASKKWTKANSPEILTGLTIVGVIVSTISAFKAGMKAKDIIDEYNDDLSYVSKDDEETYKEVKIETAKKLLPVVMKPAGWAGATVAAAFGSNLSSASKISSLAVGYNAVLSAYNERDRYVHELKTAIGDKKAAKIEEDHILNESKKKKYKKEVSKIDNMGGELRLIKDIVQQREFYASKIAIEDAFFKFKSKALDEIMTDHFAQIIRDPSSGKEMVDYYVPLNMLNEYMGIEDSDVGDILGYANIDLNELAPRWSSEISEITGEPCWALFYKGPRRLI